MECGEAMGGVGLGGMGGMGGMGGWVVWRLVMWDTLQTTHSLTHSLDSSDA